MLSVRMIFSKKGIIRYVSHLDLSRAVSRALVRSGLDIVFSEGYNPHVKLVFVQPLAIFQESEYEAADFKLHTEDISFDYIKEKLNSVMPEGITVLSCGAPRMAVNDCAFATYVLEPETELTDGELLKELSGEMTVYKKTKSGYKDVDISPLVAGVKVQEGKVYLTVHAACNKCLNPALAVQYLGDKVKSCKITRTGLYNQNMEKFM